MKVHKTLFLLVLVSFIPLISNSQDSYKLVFDASSEEFKLYEVNGTNKTVLDSDKELEKGKKLEVSVINYNPFLYSTELNKKITSQRAKLPAFIRNLVGNIPTNPTILGIKTFMFDDSIDKSGTFKKTYIQYLSIYRLLKEPKLDCTTLKSELNNIGENSLLNKYENLTKLPDNLEIDGIINLEILIKNAKTYINNNDECSKVIDTYKLKGEATQVEVVLTPKDGVSGFETPLQVIKGKKSFKIKNKWFVKFSSGIITSTIVQPDYYVEEVSTGQYQIREERRGNIIVGISTLAKINFKEDGDVSINLGGGITTEAVPHLLFGGAYEFTSGFYLDAGYSLAYRDELSDGLSSNETYTIAPASIKTKKIFASGIWFGISYKL